MKNQFYIEAIYKSLFSRGFYKSLFFSRKISYAKYIFILAIFLAIPCSLQVKNSLNKIISTDANFLTNLSEEDILNKIDFIVSQTPEITYKKNEFHSEGSEPYFIKNSNDELLAVIDTNRQISEKLESPIILKDNELIIIDNINKTKTSLVASDVFNSFQNYFEKSEENESKFKTKNFLYDLISILNINIFAIFFMCLIWFFVKYLISAILYSFLVGILISFLIKNVVFEYRLCLIISAFTLTPIVLLEFLSYSLGVKLFNFSNLVYFVTHIFYIYFAIDSFRKN
ncbi:MAG: DUF1189 family protein [Rickettsiales bacterium]|nr:DUF1189 family protein [Rickettsiales bacterium]